MREFAVCLCFKDSARYLAEWLAFYRALGADYFYLYDNGSKDHYRKITRPYEQRRVAEVIEWPGVGQQAEAYVNCLHRARGTCKWIAFMDDDEFLWPVVDLDLKIAMRRYEKYAGVAACWHLYGSSFHETPPSGLVIENYTWRTFPPVASHFKCVVRPERVIAPLHVGHAFTCVPGFQIVDEYEKPVSGPETATHSGDFLRVNHYVTKSIEELRMRRARPRADSGKVTEHSLAQWETWAREWNQTEDRGILRYLPAVKRTMEDFAPKSVLSSFSPTRLKKRLFG